MGAENSKIDTSSIERNLLRLLSKLRTETKIEKTIAYQIRTALAVYSKRSKGFKGDKQSKQTKQRIVKLIEDSNNRIDALGTFEDKAINNYGNKYADRQSQVRECESLLKHVKEKLKSNQIKPSEYEQFLKMLLYCSKQLGSNPKPKELKEEISIFILKLFIETSTESPNANSQKDIYKKSTSPESTEQEHVKHLNPKHLSKTKIGPQKIVRSEGPSKTDVKKNNTNLFTNKQLKKDNFERVATLYNKYLENMDEIDVEKQAKVEEAVKSLERFLEDATETRSKHPNKTSALETEIQTKRKKEVAGETTWYNNEHTTSSNSGAKTKTLLLEKTDMNFTDEPGERKRMRTDSTSKYTPSVEDNVFQQITKDLLDCEVKARQFSFPTRSDEYRQQKTKINNLLMVLNKKQNTTEKYTINNRIQEALRTLENNAKAKDHQEDCLKDLHNFENQVDVVMKSKNLGYQDKRNKLETYKKQINSIKSFDNEVYAKKVAIINRIQDCQNNLTDSDLLRCQAIFEKRRSFIQDFPGTVDVNTSKKEITALADYVQKLPCCNETFEQKKQSLYNEMMTTLSILDAMVQKQSLNENKWKIKSKIDKHKSEIRQWKGSPYSSTNQLYQRKKKELIELEEDIKNLPEDTGEKKQFQTEIHQLLNILDETACASEKTILSSKPKRVQSSPNELTTNLQKIKASISKYELDAQNFRYPTTSNEYETKREEVKELFNKILNLPKVKEKQTLIDKTKIILGMLYQKASANEEEAIKNAREDSNTILLRIQALDQLQHEAQNFTYPSSSNAYRRKRDEVIALQKNLANIHESGNVNDKQSLGIRLHQILNTLDQKALENENTNRNLEILAEIENNISNMSKSNLELVTQIDVLKDQKERISSLDDSNDEVSLEKSTLLTKIQSLEKEIKDQMAATAPQTETTKILDLEHHFNVTDFSNIKVPRQSLEFIEIVKNKAGIFERQVETFRNTVESVEYFVIDENLMRLTEELDKIQCHSSPPLLAKKIETLTYIKNLHKKLDDNVIKS